VQRAHRAAYESVDVGVDAQGRRWPGVSGGVVQRTGAQACGGRRWPGELGGAGGRERARHEVAALTRRAAFQINRRFH
jgi:hypothetical protein